MIAGLRTGIAGARHALPGREWAGFYNLLDEKQISIAHLVREKIRTNRGSYRMNLAQSIRDGAGLPSDQTAGLQSGVTCGASGTLTSKLDVIFDSEALFQSAASSGDGTEGSPYLIEDNEYDGAGTGSTGVTIDHAAGTYYVKFRNCNFKRHTAEEVEVTFGGYVEFENCTFYGSVTDAELIRHHSGAITLTNCKYTGCQSTAGYLATGTATNRTLAIRNLQVDASDGDWRSDCRIHQFNASDLTWDIRYVDCDVSASTSTPRSLFEPLKAADGSSFCNIACTGVNHMIRDDRFANASKTNLTIQYFNSVNTAGEAIYLTNVNGGEISYGEASHTTNGAGTRLVYLASDASDSSIRVLDMDCHHLKLTKQTGTKTAGNEALESFRGKNITFRYCWVTECPEDAYEHAVSISGCTTEYCVSDNCAGQVVDNFLQCDEASWIPVTDTSSANITNTYTHHIYGDCEDFAVEFVGLRGGVFHDIYVDNTAAVTNNDSVYISDYVDGGTTVVREVYGCGPLPIASERADAAVNINGGADIEARYFDNADGTGTMVTVTN